MTATGFVIRAADPDDLEAVRALTLALGASDRVYEPRVNPAWPTEHDGDAWLHGILADPLQVAFLAVPQCAAPDTSSSPVPAAASASGGAADDVEAAGAGGVAGAAPVGLVTGRVHDDTRTIGRSAELTQIYVEPAWRQQNVAATLTATLQEWATDHGAVALTTLAHIGNEPADRLYRGLGMEPVSTHYRMPLEQPASEQAPPAEGRAPRRAPGSRVRGFITDLLDDLTLRAVRAIWPPLPEPPLPDPDEIGSHAATAYAALTGDPQIGALTKAAARDLHGYSTRGVMSIARVDLHRDAGPLLEEAVRLCAVRAAVWEVTGSQDDAARLVVPGPLVEAEHALHSQHLLLGTICVRAGVRIIHPNRNLNALRYDAATSRGAHLVACYQAAGWGPPPERYWIGGHESDRRHELLRQRFGSIGVYDLPARHHIDFTDDPHGPVPHPIGGPGCPYHSR